MKIVENIFFQALIIFLFIIPEFSGLSLADLFHVVLDLSFHLAETSDHSLGFVKNMNYMIRPKYPDLELLRGIKVLLKFCSSILNFELPTWK